MLGVWVCRAGPQWGMGECCAPLEKGRKSLPPYQPMAMLGGGAGTHLGMDHSTNMKLFETSFFWIHVYISLSPGWDKFFELEEHMEDVTQSCRCSVEISDHKAEAGLSPSCRVGWEPSAGTRVQLGWRLGCR